MPFVCRDMKHTSIDVESSGLSIQIVVLSRQTIRIRDKSKIPPKTIIPNGKLALLGLPFVCRDMKHSSIDAESSGLSIPIIFLSRQMIRLGDKSKKPPKTFISYTKLATRAMPFVCRGIEHSSIDAEFDGRSVSNVLLSWQTNGQCRKVPQLPKS